MTANDATVESVNAEESESESPGYACPQCGNTVPAPADPSANLLVCPNCANQFFVGTEDAEDEAARLAAQESHGSEQDDEELDGLKIRQLSRKKRAAIRTRSYLLIGGFACIVAAAELVYFLIKHIRHHLPGWSRPAGYISFAIACLLVSPYFFRRAAIVKEEIDQSDLSEPTGEPDFSPLSDGSQHVKNLEDIR